MHYDKEAGEKWWQYPNGSKTIEASYKYMLFKRFEMFCVHDHLPQTKETDSNASALRVIEIELMSEELKLVGGDDGADLLWIGGVNGADQFSLLAREYRKVLVKRYRVCCNEKLTDEVVKQLDNDLKEIEEQIIYYRTNSEL